MSLAEALGPRLVVSVSLLAWWLQVKLATSCIELQRLVLYVEQCIDRDWCLTDLSLMTTPPTTLLCAPQLRSNATS